MHKQNLVQSLCVSAAVTVVFVVLITIAGELYRVPGADGKLVNPIKDFLKALHGHHWVGKGVWAVLLFLITTGTLYFIDAKSGRTPSLKLAVSLATYATILGTVVLFGFFTYEYFIAH